MSKILKIIFILFCVVGLVYLALPNYDFPLPPPDALQSKELGDTEDLTVRRAYFTNYTRAEVLNWYKNQFSKSKILDINLPTLLLNYPPEDSQTIIRDQTRSTYLQEVVHPFRESVYINGFEPKEKKDDIFIEGRDWKQKIIIRFVPSSPWMRIGIFVATAILMAIIYKSWSASLTNKKDE
jgi:hypothetical protein